MNILLTSMIDTGGVHILLTKAINKYTTHHADFIQYKRNYCKFDYDICDLEGRTRGITGEEYTINDVKRIINNADIIHKNMCASTDNLFNINLIPYYKKKKMVYHFHGWELRGKLGRYDHLKGLKIVSTPDLLQWVNNGVWLPNPCPTDEFLYTPNKFKSNIIIGFCNAFSFPGRGGKGIDIFHQVMRKLLPKYRDKIKHEHYQNIPHKIVLEKKRKNHVVFDEIYVAKTYGMTAIEAASQGLVILVNHVYGEDLAQNPPFVWVNENNLEYKTEELINKGMKYINKLGNKTRKWCKKMHDTKIVSKKLIELYESIL